MDGRKIENILRRYMSWKEKTENGKREYSKIRYELVLEKYFPGYSGHKRKFSWRGSLEEHVVYRTGQEVMYSITGELADRRKDGLLEKILGEFSGKSPEECALDLEVSGA